MKNIFKKNNDTPVDEESHKQEYELCVLCGASTGIPFSTPIEYRLNYYPGVGQLCADCAHQLFKKQ